MSEKTYRVGQWQITRIPEIDLYFDPAGLIPEWDESVLGEEAAPIIEPTRENGGSRLKAPVHSWLVRSESCRFLVDTGVGNGRQRTFAPFANLQTDYFDRLRAEGLNPNELDFVLCTHMHTDHVGWNTRADGGKWVPTFPNARYVWGRVDGAVARHPRFHQGPTAGVFEDSVEPIIEAGLFDEIEPGPFAPIDGVTFHSTPGHSPGHLAISLQSRGEEAFFGGDVLHHQVQVLRPEWNSAFCEDAEPARASRLWALGHAADSNALYFGVHLGGSSVGRVKRMGDRFTWIHE
ncbi:MBL fold metallo-hydrolase [Bradyrhizobium barranii subsp. apii]|uniref:MBL fold metallo-hydrolase n=1 Tax=Bradyrhizobium barranii subsp. apii TaxID=2819348 RepID=A0A8T5V9X0_9BRAD|nr:MBL fold metallo-hydrolase [Bradyrhizobium barranii]UPT86970.1 MBL fold metallo-hydrolase [Bradyrhizobium barranii subsp. apii]